MLYLAKIPFLVLFSTVKTFIFLGILSVRHMAWLGICYFKQWLLSLSLNLNITSRLSI